MPASGNTRMNTIAQTQTLSIDVLAQRVSNIEQAIGNLGSQLSLLNDRMTASGRTQWPVLMTFLGTMVVIVGGSWGLASKPLNAGLERQGKDIERLEAALTKVAEGVAMSPQIYLARDEYAANRLQARQDNEARLAALDSDVKALEAKVDKNAESIVPRGEHEEHWRAQSAEVAAARQERLVQIEGLQRQIDQVSAAQGGIYNARDVIRDLQNQVQALTQEVMRSGEPFRGP